MISVRFKRRLDVSVLVMLRQPEREFVLTLAGLRNLSKKESQ